MFPVRTMEPPALLPSSGTTRMHTLTSRLSASGLVLAALIVSACTPGSGGHALTNPDQVTVKGIGGNPDRVWLLVPCKSQEEVQAYTIPAAGYPIGLPSGDTLTVPPRAGGSGVIRLKRNAHTKRRELEIFGANPLPGHPERLQISNDGCTPPGNHTAKDYRILFVRGALADTTVALPAGAGFTAAEITHHSAYALAVPQ
jgi:hypothetical protein